MCGGHGLHYLLAVTAGASSAPSVDLRQQIKLMYARGEISTETFHRLMELAHHGDLDAHDLILYQRQSQHPVEKTLPRSEAALPVSAEQEHLHQLEIQLARLQAQAEDAQAAAQRPGLSEEQVRAWLETRQGALFRAELLQRQIEEVLHNVRK